MFDVMYNSNEQMNDVTDSVNPGANEVCFTYVPGFFVECGPWVKVGVST